MTKIGIIILNYMSYDITINCVKYFEQQNTDNIISKIIVVDNHSPNDSYQKLSAAFNKNNNVKVIQTPQNLGFARGNNFGYKYLLKYMRPEFVIMSNSDVYVKQPGLYAWIQKMYKEYGFGILGPAVYSVRGNFYQSPINNFSKNINYINKYRMRLKINIVKAYIKKILKIDTIQKVDKWDNPFYKEFHTDKTLHGSFEIFSKKYFKFYSMPYDPRTFMYMEEDILRLRCERHNLPMVYAPNYKIYHLQAVSTNKVTKTNSARALFKMENVLKSLAVYKKNLKE